MNIDEEKNEIKKEFQLERVILFSDAVFAIIITIMVIDIKLPESIRDATTHDLRHAFKGLTFKFIAYSLSFFLVAQFWMSHLKIFSFLKDYNKNVLILNLAFLFTVSLFPFGVSLISGGVVKPDQPEYAWIIYIYVGIIFTTILMQAILVRYLLKNKELLCYRTDEIETTLKWKVLRINFYTIPAVVVMFIIMRILNVQALYSFCAVGLYGIIMKLAFRKYYPDDEDNRSLLLQIFKKPRKIAVVSAVKAEDTETDSAGTVNEETK